MSNRNIGDSTQIDWLTVSLYLALVTIGWLMIYAVTYDPKIPQFYDLSTRHGVQLLWVGIALCAGFLILLIESTFYRTFAFIFYGVIILTLVFVLFGGTVISGSKSWIVIGGFRMQPSEFGKFATCLALASYLGAFNRSLQENRDRLISFAIIGLPLFLVILQGDAGSALVYTSFLIVFFREGLSLSFYIIGITFIILSIIALKFDFLPVLMGLFTVATILTIVINKRNYTNRLGIYLLVVGLSIAIANTYGYILPATIVLGVVFLGFWIFYTFQQKKRQFYILLIAGLIGSGIYTFSVNYGFNQILKPHQQDRIKAWLKPKDTDPDGALYNVIWSSRAIGSGGLWGKGFLQGDITRLNYVPEQATDFIFCTIGEEQGFVGVFAIIILYLSFLLRLVIIAERQRAKFSRIYAYGVAGILFFHLFINVGMTMGIAPVIGIPLPFISYGGSSLLAFTILLAILIRLDADRLTTFR